MTDKPRLRLWIGRTVVAICALFLVFDSVGKLLKVAPVVAGTTELGYAESVIIPLGIVQLSCLILYLVPRTRILGALLLTAYLGGAVATHVRVGSPLLTHVLFPTYLGAMVWGAIALMDDRLLMLLRPRQS